MANPMMSKKLSETFTATDKTKRLFQEVYREQNKKEKSDDEVPRIVVSELVSKMSFYYEKLRNMVDYKEEYLLRKNAIERILKRQITIEGKIPTRGLDSKEISKHLLVELIRAAYLPNNSVPEVKIDEVEIIIQKYLDLREKSLEILKRDPKRNTIQERNDLTNWIISMAATEIEEDIGFTGVDKVVVDYMYDILTRYIVLPEGSPYEKDRDIQIYVGIHRNYLKFDDSMISYVLFKYYTENWKKADVNEIAHAGENILQIKYAIDTQLEHPLAKQLNRLINRYTVFFTILLDVIRDNPVAVYDSFKKDPKSFPRMIKKQCLGRYKKAKRILHWAGFRSVLYIFATKLIVVYILEVPLSMFLGLPPEMKSLLINVSFPPLLLLTAIVFTKMPTVANTKKIVAGVSEIVFIEKERKEKFKLRKIVQKRGALNSIFGMIYFISFFVIFGFIVKGLDYFEFNIISKIIFLFFLALISFFSIRIKRGIKELIILPPRENIISFLLDFFFVPIISVGRWLNDKFDRVNVFIFVMDVLIEAPFKFLVEVTEQWTKYVKERKDEIV